MSAAVALANLDLMDAEGLYERVRTNEATFRATLERLLDLPIVGDVRGAGCFYGIEAGQGQGDQGDLQRGGIGTAAARVPEQGAVRQRPLLPCRRPRRPCYPTRTPLIVGTAEFNEIEQILRHVLTRGMELL